MALYCAWALGCSSITGVVDGLSGTPTTVWLLGETAAELSELLLELGVVDVLTLVVLGLPLLF